MPAFREEYIKEADDMRRQAVSDWKERVLRVEEPLIKTKERKEADANAHHAECLKTFNEMAHSNPEWHFKFMARELEWETFCLTNKIAYVPGWGNGVPGYWDFRQKHAQDWILKSRERLPDE